MSWKKITRKGKRAISLAIALVMVLSFFHFVVPVQKAEAAVAGAPANSKTLIDNGDGTYTLALSVTGAAETSTTTEVTKANVILVLDTSSSMNNNRTTYNGQSMTRLNAEKHVLADNNGIIDSLLAQNVAGDSIKSDIIEVAIVDFGRTGNVQQTWTTNATTLKNTVNGLSYSTGTNWEEGLREAKTLADTKKTQQPNEEVYIIFLTDGEPTTDCTRPANQRYNVNTNFSTEWGYASDDARGIVQAGYHFYAIFTWGSGNSSTYLSSLVQYAYTGTGTSSSTLQPAYAQYFTNATDTAAIVSALNQIVNDITQNVGYTDVEMTDGVTSMTASSVKATAGGEVTGLKYYRSGGSYSTTANNGLGEEWTDAPSATFNSKGEVDWDLGSLVLEDGVTYTITFTVWPKQESLDLVADLNNGIISYSDLTADQQSQIAVSGGHYTLKTNTDYPTVTYSTITTTTDSSGNTTTEKTDPVTVNIENPDPVGLAESKLNAVKSWDDSLDPSQREEIEDVVLYLLVDGEYYYVDPDTNEPIGVTLTEESNWEETDYISIAPGLFVAEGSPAYDPDAPQFTWDGVKYAMLEVGHEYVFEESDINNHFELTAYTHHPMIMGTSSDGTPIIKDVIFTKDASGNITGIESVSNMGDNLSATNTLKPGINILKKVVDEDNKEIDNTDPFTVTVTLIDENGNALPTKKTASGTEYTIDYRIYYGPNNPNYDAAAGGGRSGHIYKTGTSFEETLYVGDVIRVVNVEAGALFHVDETLGAGYELKETTYEISHGSASDYQAYSENVVLNGVDYYATEGNSASQVTLVNRYTFGSLQVAKTVEVESGDEEQAKDKEFTFTFNLYSDEKKTTELTGLKYSYTKTDAEGKETTGTITEGDTFTLKDGETILIEKLPEGAYYEVTETEEDGYETEAEGDTGTIVKNETAEAEFTNTYSVESVIVDPPVKKDITGNENLYNKGNFTFTIANTAAPEGVTAPMPANTSITNSAAYERTDMKGYYEFGEIEFTAPGEYTYTVTESGSAVGVTNDEEATKTLTFTVTDNGDGTMSVTPESDSAVFNFTNVYKTGELDITKTVVNTANSDDATKFTFTVTFVDAAGNTVEGSFPYTIGETTGNIASSGTLKLGNGETAKITGIPDGVSYTVEEEDVDGYANTSKTGDTGTIDSDTVATAAFTNTYSAEGEVTLKVTKAIEGAAWPEGKELTFTLTGSNAPMPETTSKTISAVGDVTFGPISFTTADAGKTYTYTISEGAGFGAGWTGSGDITATVEVADNGDGTLTATVSYTDNATITNTYEASGEATLKVVKEISGAAWPSGKTLTFTLSGEGGTLPATKTATLSAAGTATFGAIQYDESDAGKTYTYTITEDGFGAGWTGSGDITAKVQVTDNGDGTLSTTVTYSPEDDTIINTYKAEGSIELQAKKSLTGRAWKDGETVTFTLLDPDGAKIEEKTIGENGTITFSAIQYDESDAGKTYKYTISETSNLPGGVSKSGDITATVKVIDNGDGTLKTEVTYTNDDTIINTYTTDDVSAKITVTKTIDGYIEGEDVNGKTLDRTFNFEMTGPKIDGSLKTSITTKDGKGSASFDEIKYTFDDMKDDSGNTVGEKVFSYTVTETAGSDAGFTYDTNKYTVNVTVKDDLEGHLTVTDITKVDDESNVNIINKYTEKKVEVQIHLTKIIEDLSNSAKDGTFTFKLIDANGNIIEEKEVKTSGLKGSVDFSPITFEKSGTYSYTLQEIAPVEEAGEESEETPTEEATPVEDAAEEDPAKKAAPAEDVPAEDPAKEAAPAEDVPAEDPAKEAAPAEDAPAEDPAKEAAPAEDAPAEDPAKEAAPAEDAAVEDPAKEAAPAEDAAPAGEASKGDTNAATNGWTYDTKAYPVIIQVVDNFDTAQLKATVTIDGTETTELTVTNIYQAASTESTLEVTKEIEDTSGSAYDTVFEFTLKDADGKTIGTASVTGEGKATFDPITYEKAGTYNYTITETAGDAAGYIYDTETYPVIVTVEDKEGKLVATVAYGNDSSTELTVTNIYDPEDAEADLQARKVVDDQSDSAPDETFTFQLLDADGNVVETVTRENGGYVYFKTLTFDKVGTYNYTIQEVSGSTAGYTYDTEGRKVQIDVTDDGKGNLKAEVTYLTDEGEAVITNPYKAEPTSIKLNVKKTVKGLAEGAATQEFTFVLADSEGKTVQKITIDGSGSAKFDAIKFEKAGTYTYTVTETAGSAKGYTYDTAKYTVKITVTDEGGKLTAAAEYTKDGKDASAITFTNNYKPDAATVDLTAKKVLLGRDLNEGEFEFAVEIDGEVKGTAKNAADGTVTFDTLSFDKAGTYALKIYEVKGDIGGVTFDEQAYEGTITVTDSGDGKLAASVSIGDGESAEITFQNTYKPNRVTVDLSAMKIMKGRKLAEGEFEFVLEIDGEQVNVVKNDKDGYIAFTTLAFDEVGEHTFRIYEVKGDEKGVTYDEKVYEGTISITDDGKGQLVATVKGADSITFTNSYEEETPDTGDYSNFNLWLALMAISGMGLIGLTVVQLKPEKRTGKKPAHGK